MNFILSMKPSLCIGTFLLIALPCAAAGDPVAEAKAAWKARDYAKAAELIARPAAEGNPAALYLKGLMAETGRGAPRAPADAAKLYKQAMDKGNADATGAYGRFLIHGLGGIEKDAPQGLFV